MPDWLEIVRRRLGALDLNRAEGEEICAEIAAHFEEEYEHAIATGASEKAAIQRALHQVKDWKDLRSRIEFVRKSEPPMNKRVSQFWFPALVTIFLAMVFLMLIEKFGPKPWISPAWSGSPRMAPVALVYFAWVLTLPFVGALGAWLSVRAGGGSRTVFSSIIFPIAPYLAFFMIGLPVAMVLDDHVAHNIMLPAFFVGFGAWVLLPGLALLVGGMPVHFFSRRAGSQA